MQIQKLNPIGYEAKTEKGNTYKRSNIAKTTLVASAIALNAAPLVFKKNSFLQMFTSYAMMQDIFRTLNIKTSPKMKIPLTIIGIASDLIFGYLFGAAIDNSTNKSRAVKADQAARNLQNEQNVDIK